MDEEEKSTERRRPKEKMEMTEGKRMRTIEDKVRVCLRGLDNGPAGCNAITVNPNLRRSRGRSGPRRRRKNKNQSVRSLFQSSSTIQKCSYNHLILGFKSTFVPKLKKFTEEILMDTISQLKS